MCDEFRKESDGKLCCGGCPFAAGILLICILSWVLVADHIANVAMYCLNEEVDLYFPLVLMVILAADITAAVLIFRHYG